MARMITEKELQADAEFITNMTGQHYWIDRTYGGYKLLKDFDNGAKEVSERLSRRELKAFINGFLAGWGLRSRKYEQNQKT